MLTNIEDVKSIVTDCYRKFKSHVYYSNNLQKVRLKISEFEQHPEEMDKRINVLSDIIYNESEKGWNELLNSVSYYVLPKISIAQTSSQRPQNDEQIISNCSSDIKIDKVNFFVDVPVEIYILDTLWTVFAGKLIVEKHIFNGEVCANRLNKKIYNSKEKSIVDAIDFKNLSIYYPYFKGYKRWKNRAIQCLEKQYDAKFDSTLISLDLTSYFYSANVNFDYIRELLVTEDDKRYDGFSFLTESIKKLYCKYSELIRTIRTDISENQIIIPIGLISSGIVSNIYLHSFDEKIQSKNNVVYYSRYVDDLLVIINSASGESNLDSIINEHFSDCLKPVEDRIEIIGYPGLIIQNSKIKVLKLFSNQSKNYINILKQEITNSSETQLLPSVDVELKKFISQAYSRNEDSLKIRDMDSLNINTLSVMRFIGSYLRSKKNTQDKPENSNKKKYKLTYYEQIDRETQEQLELFFKGSTLFSLYLKWDKIFAFAILYKQDFSLAKSIYDDILENIEGITGTYQYIRRKSQRTVSAALRKALKSHLKACFAMALSVRYDMKLYKKTFKSKTDVLQATIAIQKANMFDNSLVEFPMLNYYRYAGKGKTIYSGLPYNEYIQKYVNAEIDDFSIKFSPRFIHFQEYCLSQSILKIDQINSEEFLKTIYCGYQGILNTFSSYSNSLSLNINTKSKTKNSSYIISEISAYSPCGYYDVIDRNSDIYIALANINLNKHKLFEHGKFNFIQCSFERKSELYKLLNEAYVFTKKKLWCRNGSSLTYGQTEITAKRPVKFLAFPEVSIPLEWIEDIAKFARITGTAVICGVKHFIKGDKIYNCVATIVPVGNNAGYYHNALVVLREKNDYSPEEISLIEYNNYKHEEKDKSYNCIFNWDNIKFSVFDCYELTDIYARAIMKSQLDILFAPEYNKDINYFSNIVESASRDIYCFVVQINTSNYGDTKIIAPYKTELKCIANIKGGERDSIHIGKINVEEFREYQKFEGSDKYKQWTEWQRKRDKDEKKTPYYKFKKYKKTSARHKK